MELDADLIVPLLIYLVKKEKLDLKEFGLQMIGLHLIQPIMINHSREQEM
jgi:hypothetical protein